MVRRTIPLFAVISLALLPAIPAQAQQPGWFEVSLKGSITGPWIHGCGFASPVDVVVMDTDGTTQLLNESASFDGGCFVVEPSFGLLPGMFVSVSDGSSTGGLTLVPLSIDVINPETGTASGTAPPNTAFHVDTDVCPGPCQNYVSAYPVSDGEGAWTADFGALRVELVPGEDLGADIFDEPITAARSIRSRSPVMRTGLELGQPDPVRYPDPLCPVP